MPKPTYEELVELVAVQARQIEFLTDRVAELERRLATDSSNSSRPPSSDSPYTKKPAKPRSSHLQLNSYQTPSAPKGPPGYFFAEIR